MIKIGILPSCQIFEKDNPYNDIYKFYNIFSKKIFEFGAIPIGILLNDGKIDINSLEMCDAFLIEGGNKIEPYFFETINYAIKNNKPLLGICLGMQSIGVYSYLEMLLRQENKELTVKNFYNMFKKIKEDNVYFLKTIDNHYNEKPTRSNYLKNQHKVEILKDTKLYSIYKENKIDVVSMHKYIVNKYGDTILINCIFDDVIEGLEYKDDNLFILGIQWHPELEDKHNILFKRLIEEAQKRKN